MKNEILLNLYGGVLFFLFFGSIIFLTTLYFLGTEKIPKKIILSILVVTFLELVVYNLLYGITLTDMLHFELRLRFLNLGKDLVQWTAYIVLGYGAHQALVQTLTSKEEDALVEKFNQLAKKISSSSLLSDESIRDFLPKHQIQVLFKDENVGLYIQHWNPHSCLKLTLYEQRTNVLVLKKMELYLKNELIALYEPEQEVVSNQAEAEEIEFN